MFGTSIKGISPQDNVRNVLALNTEIEDTLKDLGFINSDNSLLQEDYIAISNRMDVIKKEYLVPSKVLISLAYIDRMVFDQKSKGNKEAESKLISAIDTGLVSALVSNPILSQDEEFLQTVVNLSSVYYNKGSYIAFSDALFEALKDRMSQIKQNPDLDGKIDAQSNVTLEE